MLCKNSADNILITLSQKVDNLHGMSEYFPGKNEKNIINLSSAEVNSCHTE